MIDDPKARMAGFTRMVNNLPGSTTTGRAPRQTPTISTRQQPRQYSEPVFRIQPYGPTTPSRETDIYSPPPRRSPFYDALRKMFRQKGLPERFWR